LVLFQALNITKIAGDMSNLQCWHLARILNCITGPTMLSFMVLLIQKSKSLLIPMVNVRVCPHLSQW
jgi:hypothetical protein